MILSAILPYQMLGRAFSIAKVVFVHGSTMAINNKSLRSTSNMSQKMRSFVWKQKIGAKNPAMGGFKNQVIRHTCNTQR